MYGLGTIWTAINRINYNLGILAKRLMTVEENGGGNTGGGGGTDPGVAGSVFDDTTAPAMTKAELASATGIVRNTVYLTDGTNGKVLAVRDRRDTSSPPLANTIIIDGNGVRWRIESYRSLFDKYNDVLSPYN